MSNVEIEVFHDGKCPLCQREMQLLQRLDRARAIRFVDISADGFDPVSLGVSWQTLMDRIHARLPDGTLIEGVEVFRRLYAAVGFRRLAAFSRLPGVAQLLSQLTEPVPNAVPLSTFQLAGLTATPAEILSSNVTISTARNLKLVGPLRSVELIII